MTAGAIYDPSQPIGSRWQEAADSAIPRLYHSSAILTQNAEVPLLGFDTLHFVPLLMLRRPDSTADRPAFVMCPMLYGHMMTAVAADVLCLPKVLCSSKCMPGSFITCLNKSLKQSTSQHHICNEFCSSSARLSGAGMHRHALNHANALMPHASACTSTCCCRCKLWYAELSR